MFLLSNFLLICTLATKSKTAFSLSVSPFTLMEKYHTTSDAVSKREKGVLAWREGSVMCQWLR